MNQVIEGIKKRRSCRAYESRQISDEELNEILECGLLAPSGRNQQGIKFTVIQNKDVLDRLKEMVGRDFIYGAPTLVVVHAPESYKFVETDGSVAIENMYIAANALGLGACWINQLKDYYGNGLLNELGLEKNIVTGSLALGYPSTELKEREINRDRINFIK